MRNGMFPMEAAPRDGTPVILVNKHGAIDADVWWTGDFWMSLLGELDDDYVGWMPSPNIQYPAGVIPKTEAEKLLDEAQNALAECLDYFEDRYDVNWEGDGPNEEMSIGQEVAAILAKLEARDA